jgi:hypothetical protein
LVAAQGNAPDDGEISAGDQKSENARRHDAPIGGGVLAKVAAPHHRGATPGIPPAGEDRDSTVNHLARLAAAAGWRTPSNYNKEKVSRPHRPRRWLQVKT